MFQDEGASTDITGRCVSWSAVMTDGKGSRIEPEKEKPGWCQYERPGP